MPHPDRLTKNIIAATLKGEDAGRADVIVRAVDKILPRQPMCVLS